MGEIRRRCRSATDGEAGKHKIDFAQGGSEMRFTVVALCVLVLNGAALAEDSPKWEASEHVDEFTGKARKTLLVLDPNYG